MGKGFDNRQKIILDCLQKYSEVKVSTLVELTGAAIATIRRDLLEMEKRNQLVRTFGGARAIDVPSLVERTFEERLRHSNEEKMRIAAKAAELVEPGMTIVIDSGTTCWTLVKHLKSKAPLRIFTSALAVIEDLGSVEGIEINLVGGRFRIENLDFFGPSSIKSFGQFHADVAFLSCDGLLPDKGAYSHDNETAAMSQAMLECASKHILLCDSTKIGRAATFLIMHPREIDVLVTDKPNPELASVKYTVLVPDTIN